MQEFQSISVYRFFLVLEVGNFRVALGKVRAVRLYRRSAKRVPVYKDYIAKHKIWGPVVTVRFASLSDVPEMDKASCIKQYSIIEKIPKR